MSSSATDFDTKLISVSRLKQSASGPLLVVALACCTLLLGLGWPQLWDRDEPRNAGCTAEMLARGDWVVPMFNSELRTHKPILLYWLQMAAYQIVGANEWGARLPSALLMMGTIFCAMLLSSRLLTHRFLVGIEKEVKQCSPLRWFQWNSPAMWSGVVLATSLMVVVAGRASTPDSPLIFCSTLSITAFLFALTTSPLETRSRLGYLVLGYIGLGLGVLAKGPVGFVLPITVVSAWFQWERICQDTRLGRCSSDISIARQWRLWLPSILARLSPKAVWDYIVSLKLLPGILIVLGVALPWYIWVGLRTDGRWLREFFWEHNVQRAVQSLEGHRGGPWYYPVAMLVGLFPWSLWLAPFLVWLWKSAPLGYVFTKHQSIDAAQRHSLRQTQIASLSRLSVLWVAVYIGAFSCANTKLPSYITPCYPGAALLVGLFLAALANRVGETGYLTWLQVIHTRAMRYAVSATLGTTLIIGIGATIGLAMTAAQEQMQSVVWQSFWGISLTLAALCAAYTWWRAHNERMPALFALGAVICISGWMVGGATQASRYRLDLQALQQIQESQPEQRWVAVGVLEPSWIYYTGHSIPEIPIATNNPHDTHGAESISLNSAPPLSWQTQVVQRWESDPKLGVITLQSWADELTQHVNQLSASGLGSYRIVRRERPYFLRHQPLCLLTLEPLGTRRDETAEQKSTAPGTEFRR